jgi:hypothetical protein
MNEWRWNGMPQLTSDRYCRAFIVGLSQMKNYIHGVAGSEAVGSTSSTTSADAHNVTKRYLEPRREENNGKLGKTQYVTTWHLSRQVDRRKPNPGEAAYLSQNSIYSTYLGRYSTLISLRRDKKV